MTFVPRSKRGTKSENEHLALKEGVPPHLAASLYSWVQEQVLIEGIDEYGLFRIMPDVGYIRRIELEMQEPLGTNDERLMSELLKRCHADAEWWLDLIDYLLRNPLPVTSPRPGILSSPRERARQLEDYLYRGNSAWTVRPFGEAHSLERRVEEAVESAMRDAAARNPTAGQYLTSAWHLAYGRSPSAGQSYGDSIKAVEAAAIPVISPRDSKATLGTILGAMRANPGKWTVQVPATSAATPGEQLIVAMMNALWTGQAGRHGTPTPSTPASQTQIEAEAAVHLAATLVHWFSTGVIR